MLLNKLHTNSGRTSHMFKPAQHVQIASIFMILQYIHPFIIFVSIKPSKLLKNMKSYSSFINLFIQTIFHFAFVSFFVVVVVVFSVHKTLPIIHTKYVQLFDCVCMWGWACMCMLVLVYEHLQRANVHKQIYVCVYVMYVNVLSPQTYILCFKRHLRVVSG